MQLILYIICCSVWLCSTVMSINQFLIGVGEPYSTTPVEPSPFEYGFKQKVDHFNPNDKRQFIQRFDMNDEFYEAGGPAFLFVVGAEAKSKQWMRQGTWIEFAREFKAMCYQLEHRFYGRSTPSNNFSTEHLSYLNTKQAVADLAYFITSHRKSPYFKPTTKWVVFGGSYAGSLAAFVRKMHPNIVQAAVSSSATMLPKVELNEYFKNIEVILEAYDKDCFNKIKMANIVMKNLLKTDEGAERLRRRFKLVINPLNRNKTNQVYNFFSSVAYSMANIIQYSNVNRYYNDPARSIASMETLCDEMNDESVPDLVDRYASAVRVNRGLLSMTHSKYGSIPSYDYLIALYERQSWAGERENARLWHYQSCSEYGFFQTSDQHSNVFGPFPLDYFKNMCTDVFGESFSLERLSIGAKTLNDIYNGLNPLSEPRTIFVYGTNDPWLTNRTQPANAYSVLIEGASHCADMYPPSQYDSRPLQEARRKIKTHLKKLLES